MISLTFSKFLVPSCVQLLVVQSGIPVSVCKTYCGNKPRFQFRNWVIHTGEERNNKNTNISTDIDLSSTIFIRISAQDF